MSVGKNSIKRAVGSKSSPAKVVPVAEDEVKNAAPELANSCVTPAAKPAAKKPVAKSAAAKKPAAKSTAAKPAAKKPAAAPAPTPAVPAAAPSKEAERAVSVTQELPYWLL